MNTYGFEVGCRVVCIDANFHEICYRLCRALPHLDRVYTVSELIPDATNIITKKRSLGLRVKELPLPLNNGVMPTWGWWRFLRLDDPSLMRVDEDALLDPVEAAMMATARTGSCGVRAVQEMQAPGSMWAALADDSVGGSVRPPGI